MILQPAYPVKNAERLKTHFEEFTSTRTVSFNHRSLRATIDFIDATGLCGRWISSEDGLIMAPFVAATLNKAIIIFTALSLNHFCQRWIVDSSAAIVILLLSRVNASSMELVP